MSDLELTKICAEAMGIDFGDVLIAENTLQLERNERTLRERVESYDPIHNDAQVIALVKRFSLNVWKGMLSGIWYAENRIGEPYTYSGSHEDLNRAIVECVAKLHAGKAMG